MNVASIKDLICSSQAAAQIRAERRQYPVSGMRPRPNPWACLLLSSLVLALPLAPASAEDAPPDDWQLRRLMYPTPSELANEQRGGIFIYDGLEQKDVNRAMDVNFGRIENMMFIRTRVPRPSEPEVTQVEDDGC